jgi:hypothetical protein
VSLDAEHLAFGEEVPHHASHDHVYESVDPQRRHQDEEKPDLIEDRRGLVPHREVAADEGGELPECAHDQHPAVGFPVVDCLDDVGGGGKEEEYCERNRRPGVGAEGPHIVRIVERWEVLEGGA